MSSKGDINRRVLAIQAKKKRKNPKGARKPGNAVNKDDKDGPPTPGGGARENAANINGQVEKHGVHSQGQRPAHLKTMKRRRRRYLAPMMMSKRIPKIM